MARNTTAMKRGWNYDISNTSLKAMVDGKEAFALKAATLYATYKVGEAYEASASIIDGYGVSLTTGYGASLSNRLFGLGINADTGSTDLTGDTYQGAIRGRLVIGTTQTNASLMGVIGCVDVGASKNIQGNVFGLDGVLDFYGASTAGSGASFYAGAGRFTLWNEGTTTVGVNGVLCGIDICQTSGKPTLGSGAINPAVHIRSQAAKEWQYGIYMTAGSITTGIYIGTCTTGVNVEGTITLALGIGSTTALTTVTTATSAVKVQSNFTGLTNTYHIANFFISQYTAAGTGSLRTVVGQVDLSGTQTTANTAQYLVGVHGRAKVSGTAYNTALFVTGVMGQILAGGTWTAANHVSAIWGDWQLASAVTAGSTELLYLSNNANSETGNPTNVMFVYAPRMTNFINFSGVYTTAGGMCAESAAAGTMTHTVKCLVNGTAAYIHLFNS